MNRIRLLSALTISPLAWFTSAPPSLASADPCPGATVDVATADELQEALDGAEPGDVLQLADRTYFGKFVTTASGTEASPIFLCGTSNAILDGDGVRGGYGLHLDGASHWRLVGFTVRNAQKGVMVDHGTFNVIEGLTVTHIGDEAIHLRAFSTDNIVRGNTISDTGSRRDKFGEGVYAGSAQSNW
jgi:nitrous oxidase accessory protein NosD